MNIILLSGGSGKRLWPLSNDVRSKQFIKLFKDGNKYESMVQRVYRQITTVDRAFHSPYLSSPPLASWVRRRKRNFVTKKFEIFIPLRYSCFVRTIGRRALTASKEIAVSA